VVTRKHPFELLMQMCAEVMGRAAANDSAGPTLGGLAEKWGEPIERVMDAIDAVRVLAGERTYVSVPPGSGS
jgi:SpoU rRNA methylase family enzyme